MIQASAVSARSYHRVAVDMTDSQNFEDALTAIDQAIILQQNNPLLLVDKSLILKQLDRNFEAQRVYDRALAIDFNYVTSLVESEAYQPLEEL